MAFRLPGSSVRTETMWYILSAFFFTVGLVSALGEWVFHWWQDPGQWAALVGFALSVLAFVWGASAKDVRGMREEMRGFREESRRAQAEHSALLRENTALLREQTALLREVVASFRSQGSG